MMENDFIQLDLTTLKTMHEQESAELNRLLLNGANWQDLHELKYRVVQLSIALHKRTRQTDQEGESMESGQPEVME